MKMDIEGHEIPVLSGLTQALSKGIFDYIQFKYGGCNIGSRTFLLDFYKCFENTPYRLAKIHPDGLEYVSVYDQIFKTATGLLRKFERAILEAVLVRNN